MDRSSKQNINKDIVALNNTLDEMDLSDTCRAFHPKNKNTHSFQMHMGVFTDRPHKTKTCLYKFKKIEIISSIFSDHRILKLESNLKEKTQNTQNHGD